MKIGVITKAKQNVPKANSIPEAIRSAHNIEQHKNMEKEADANKKHVEEIENLIPTGQEIREAVEQGQYRKIIEDDEYVR